MNIYILLATTWKCLWLEKSSSFVAPTSKIKLYGFAVSFFLSYFSNSKGIFTLLVFIFMGLGVETSTEKSSWCLDMMYAWETHLCVCLFTQIPKVVTMCECMFMPRRLIVLSCIAHARVPLSVYSRGKCHTTANHLRKSGRQQSCDVAASSWWVVTAVRLRGESGAPSFLPLLFLRPE